MCEMRKDRYLLEEDIVKITTELEQYRSHECISGDNEGKDTDTRHLKETNKDLQHRVEEMDEELDVKNHTISELKATLVSERERKSMEDQDRELLINSRNRCQELERELKMKKETIVTLEATIQCSKERSENDQKLKLGLDHENEILLSKVTNFEAELKRYIAGSIISCLFRDLAYYLLSIIFILSSVFNKELIWKSKI